MDRLEARTRARELLEAIYVAEPDAAGRESGRTQLAELARAARAGGAPLDAQGGGPWHSDRCRLPHGGGDDGSAGPLTCVMRGEFELPLPEPDAAAVAALLNWAEVPEPGAQT